MTTAAPELLPKLVTADELLAMGDIGRCELIYGKLVMMSPAGAEHGSVTGEIYRLLANFVTEHGIGRVFAAETGFKIETDPDLVRAPDAGFLLKERLTRGLPKGFFTGVPDLAVEVVSPGDTAREVAEKVNLWLAHGTRTAWVADPSVQTLTVHHVGEPPLRLGLGQTLVDEPLLPGFSLEVGGVFQIL